MEKISILVAEVLPMIQDWLKETIGEEVKKALEADRLQAKPEPMLTRDEVCRLLHMTKVTLWQKTKRGEIDATHVGRRVLYTESQVKRLMKG